MSNLNKKYEEVLHNLENNIKNSKDLEYAKEQLRELTEFFINEMETLQEKTTKTIDELSQKQTELEDKMKFLEKSVKEIENDIYEADDVYDLEIVCPYCNYEFVLEDDTEKEEVECPECGNIIEIDWDGESFEEGCGGHCSSCGSQCGMEEDDEDDEPKNNKNDNEDDM